MEKKFYADYPGATCILQFESNNHTHSRLEIMYTYRTASAYILDTQIAPVDRSAYYYYTEDTHV